MFRQQQLPWFSLHRSYNMCIHQPMCPIIRLIITDTIRPGLDLQQLWQLVFIVPIIGVIMVVIMVVITVVVIIMAVITSSLIPATGIKSIITTIAETHPIRWPI